MEQMEMLRKLFDEKIITILNQFLDNPDRKFSLTQVASISRINISTTLRILDKLVKQEIVELVRIGKSKFYKMKRSERTMALNRLLRREDHIHEFIEKLKRDFRVKKVILEIKSENGAKLVIVGNFLSKDKIDVLVEEIKDKYNFRIQFVEISEKQFSEMEGIGLYGLGEKVIWERT